LFALNEKILRAGYGNILIANNMFTIHYQHDKAHGWNQEQKIKDRRQLQLRAGLNIKPAQLDLVQLGIKMSWLGSARSELKKSARLGLVIS